MNNQSKIIVGVTGGISAYKACEIVRGFQKEGFDVWVVMTQNATRFVTPLTFRALTGHPITTALWENEISPYAHITLTDDATALVIAPATANVLAKVTYGLADDALSSTVLAANMPIFIAPAMNERMYMNTATQSNLQTLIQRGIHILQPDEGHLACGTEGIGKLPDPQVIVRWVLDSLNR